MSAPPQTVTPPETIGTKIDRLIEESLGHVPPNLVRDIVQSLADRRKKCYASLAFGAIGLGVTFATMLGYLSSGDATIGIGLTTSAAVLVREFCG